MLFADFATQIAGGTILGNAAVIRLLGNGKITGVSGTVGSLVSPNSTKEQRFSAGAFLGGLLGGGIVMSVVAPSCFEALPADLSSARILLAGACVGLGNGCTSGHGICGVGRLSPRSIAATATFMTTGILSATLLKSGAEYPIVALAPIPSGSLVIYTVSSVALLWASLFNAGRARGTPREHSASLAVDATVGLTFGVGLAVSAMTRPSVVLSFLDASDMKHWSPAMVFVMGSALAIVIPSFSQILRRKSPVIGEGFSLSKLSKIDAKLLLGAGLFGIGWGILGICPGPAIVSLPSGGPQLLKFLGVLFASTFAVKAAGL